MATIALTAPEFDTPVTGNEIDTEAEQRSA